MISAAKTWPSGSLVGKKFHRAELVIFVLPIRFNVVLLVHTFRFVEFPFSKIRGPDSQYETLSQCLDPALISAAPHYGLRYGCAPATGNFQRLRGRPPLVSPLKSCIGRSFTAVTRVQIPSGTPNLFSRLREFLAKFAVHRRYKFLSA